MIRRATTALVGIFLLCGAFFTAPAPAHALGLFGCGASAATGGAVSAAHAVVAVPVSNLPIETNTGILRDKECILDGLGIALAEGMIAALTQSLVDWINNGFEGGPSFVTNLSGFLGEIADNTALDFIEGTELGFLCSPFELEIRIALAVQRQPFQKRITCSLGEVTDNAERFFAGDFSSGGWPAWFKVNTQYRNSPYGSLYLASAELDARIRSRQWEEDRLLSFGDGFFSKGKCSLPLQAGGGNSAGTFTGGEQQGFVQTTGLSNFNTNTATKSGCLQSGGSWNIVTPGQQINEQLNNALGTGQRKLELADEFDEVVSALLAQLAQQALTSIDGIVGLSSRSSSSARTIASADGSSTARTGSYLDALVYESTTGSLLSAESALVADIENAIALEEDYQDALTRLISAEEQYFCAIGIAGGAATTTPSLGVSALEDALDRSAEVVGQLVSIRAAARAGRDADELNAAAERYDALLQGGVIHSASDIAFTLQDAAQREAAVQATVAGGTDITTCLIQ